MIFQQILSFSVHPKDDIKENRDKEYRVYFELDKVLDGCPSTLIGSYYDFNYNDLENFYNHTLNLQSELDIQNAISIFNGKQNDKKDLITTAMLNQIMGDFNNPPSLLHINFGQTEWNKIQKLMGVIGSSITIYELEGFEVNLMKAELIQLPTVKDIKPDKEYIAYIKMPKDHRSGVHEMWVYIKKGMIYEVVIEQTLNYMTSMFWYDFENSFSSKNVNQYVISMSNEEEQQRKVILPNQNGYIMEFPLESGENKKSCIIGENLRLYAYNPKYQENSVFLSIFRQNYILENVDRLDMYEGCIYLK